MASKVNKVQLIHNGKDINQILTPTSQKVTLAVIFTAVTILLSLVNGSIYDIVVGSPVWNAIASILFFIINFGGGIGNTIYSLLNGSGQNNSNNILLFYGLPIVFQLIYLYLIVGIILPSSNHKRK